MRVYCFANKSFRFGLVFFLALNVVGLWHAVAANDPVSASSVAPNSSRLEKRWLFFWDNMSDPKVVDGMLARFSEAKAAGYNGVVFPWDVTESKAAALRSAARENGLDLVAAVMNGVRDRNNVEGVAVKDALFVAHDGRAALQPDNPTRVVNGDFEDVRENHFNGWSFQDDEGVTTFADHGVTHGGKTSLRMENIGKNPYHHCRLAQPLRLQPWRQYHVSFWVKTEGFTPADAEVKVLTTNAEHSISFQTFHIDPTQDWKQCDIVFNSLEHDRGTLYVGSWSGDRGKIWWDDLRIEEIGLVNVLRRPGCPVSVRGENGEHYEEGRDYARIADPLLNPWQSWHEPPVIKLTADSRIPEGARLRVSYYHPLIVYQDNVHPCLSEPAVLNDWSNQVWQANERYHPAAFLMCHDELRVVNQCALCRSRHLTAGELLAWNVHQCAMIIRGIRPDAGLWVWSDMFDPMHNAVDHYYAANGTLAGSWKGLDPGIGVVNWDGGLKGANCPFFARLGLRQILSGYYDGDESGDGIAEWLAKTRNVPGIVGVMYTTWENKYGAMTVWAQKAWGQK